MGSSTGEWEIFESTQGNPSSDFLIVELSNEMINFSGPNDDKPFMLRVEVKVGFSGRTKVVIFSFGGITILLVKRPLWALISLCPELQSVIFVFVCVK